MGRPPTCDCGSCEKCRRRVYAREFYHRPENTERYREIARWVDLNETTLPTFVGDAHDLRALGIEDESYDLVILDPPYSDDEAAELYGTPPLRPAIFTAEAVRVCKTGGHVAVYHRVQPTRPRGTRLVHRIVVLTRSLHAPRVCFVFRKEAPAPTLFGEEAA